MRNLERFLAASALAAVFTAAAAAQPTLEPRLKPLPTDLMGPFVRLGDGSILAVTSEATVVSKDGGKTWSEPRPLFPKEKGLKVSNERALLRTKDGTLVVVFMNIPEQKWKWDNVKNEPAIECSLPVYAARSLDDGKTWQDVQKIQAGYCGAIRDLIETKDGHLVVPVQRLLPKEARHATMPFVSFDGGKTWKETTLLDGGGRGHHDGSIEATVEQLTDGRLRLLARTSRDFFWEAFSSDGGLTWKDFRKSDIAASSSPAMLKRLASGRLILLWNRLYPEGKTETPRRGAPWSETPASYQREELSLALSEDDGKTWSEPVVIARLPGKWVSYPYLFERQPGELWVTTMQGGLRAVLNEKDFLGKPEPKEQGRRDAEKSKVVVAFGDSTTAPRGPLAVYAALLKEAGVEVVNAGVGGNTTALARARFERDVLARKPTTVVIQFGINDAAVDVWKKPSATEPRVPLAEYEKNLSHFVTALKEAGATPIVMTPNPLRWTAKLREMYGKPPYKPDDADGFNVLLRDYADAARKVAAREKVELVDVFAAFEAHGKQKGQSVDELLLDGMHPNDKGHRLVADLLLARLGKPAEKKEEKREPAPPNPEFGMRLRKPPERMADVAAPAVSRCRTEVADRTGRGGADGTP